MHYWCTSLLLLSIVACNAQVIPPELYFLEGFVQGLATDFGNITECTKDIDFSINEFIDSIGDISQGIRTENLFLIVQGLTEFGNGLNELKPVVQACGDKKLVQDIEKIISDFSTAEGAWLFALRELQNIFSKYNDLQIDFITADIAFKTGDLYTGGYYVGVILGILIEAN